MKYTEGDWFGVPLRDGGFAIGVLARTNPKAAALLGYFFGPRRLVLPSLEDVAALKASAAILVGRFSDLGLIGGAWPIIGPAIGWNRADWPTPVFARQEELTGRWLMVTYDDDDPAKHLRDEPVSVAQAEGLPKDGSMGSGFVEIRLTRLLGLDGLSRDIAQR